MVEAVQIGIPQREIQKVAYEEQKSLERNEKVVVGY